MKLIFAILALPLVAFAAVTPAEPAPAEEPAVFTVERVFMTIIEEDPFMVPVTETVVWTQSPSIAPSTPTARPQPTLDSSYDQQI